MERYWDGSFVIGNEAFLNGLLATHHERRVHSEVEHEDWTTLISRDSKERLRWSKVKEN